MPEDRKADLHRTITLFESLLESYKVTRERLIARRRGAADHVMVELDDRVAASTRTIESFTRSVACLRAQLDSLQSHVGCEGLFTDAAPGERSEGARTKSSINEPK